MRINGAAFSCFVGMIMLISTSANANNEAAVAEIIETVHGIEKTAYTEDTLDLTVINVGADYDFMALVACGLLDKHEVEGVSSVVIRDVRDQQNVLGQFICADRHKEEEDKNQETK